MEVYITIYLKIRSIMERDVALFKTQVSFTICSDDIYIDPASITDTLLLTPSRAHRKGDTWISKHSGSLCTHAHTVWSIESEWTTFEDDSVSHHIKYLKNLLLPKAEIVKRYKEDNRYDVSFWIWIETDDTGIGLELTDDELRFLNEFSNWVHFSLLATSSAELTQTVTDVGVN